jgi:hypothetical protein
MSESAIRTAIYNVLSGVNSIGKVYDYERWAKDWGTFIDLFKATINGKEHIRGWEISRSGPVNDDGSTPRAHTYKIRGYMSINDADATEKTFNALIEAIADAFRGDKTLGGVALGHDFIQVDLIEPRMFGSVLCHYAELSIIVYEHIYY